MQSSSIGEGTNKTTGQWECQDATADSVVMDTACVLFKDIIHICYLDPYAAYA